MGDSMHPAHPRITRNHSCFSCQQRKVRCDGQQPCSSCRRNRIECVPGRRTKPSMQRREAGRAAAAANERLVRRLRCCEEALREHGIQVDDEQTGETASRELLLPPPAPPQGQMIVKSKDSRYVENWLWKGLSDELQDPENLDADEESQFDIEPPESEPLSLFGDSRYIDLHGMHPPAPQLFQLWQVYLNNVNPIVKIFHAQTVQRMVLDAAADLRSVSRSTEALLFAIYTAAVTSTDEETCLRLLAESRVALISRFSKATKQALTNAEFLRSTNIITLQALTLYLLATRHTYEPHTLWLFTGIASRTARAMGLHREASLRGFSVFEQENRRRLWWQILILDSRSAQLSGVAVNPDSYLFWDTRCPLNLNDSDLVPSMRELPAEYDGPTEMLFCRIRFEVGECMRRLKTLEHRHADDGNSSAAHRAEESQLIDELEARLEQRYLKKCDPSIPFHLLALYLGRSSVCQMRLSMHTRQWYSGKGPSLAQAERDQVFSLGLEIIGYDNLAYSHKPLQPYRWHVAMAFPFEALILVLTELLARFEGDLVRQAWERVNQLYADHPEIITAARTNTLVSALVSLTTRAWDKLASTTQNSSHLLQYAAEPQCISKLRSLRRDRRPSSPSAQVSPVLDEYLSPAATAAAVRDTGQDLVLSGTTEEPAVDISQIDWSYWQALIEGEGAPFQR
ncbi:fungal specific transcription factor domain-containing protein [Nannizzia gypsea CBS 118893]|uniref:C6 finger domain transcription factor nscR n=1 Tax=Arthroderma gypseum (strain ATCC MYA-4604 / CBS 118893) TaxID=535722 RepID=E4V6Q1_ARTGP|nr:fungal specific transcription factor domain-containing protein [Nannizzia gypsea CBS 118893]EFQ96767.1 fungal specific transcription factor domain-containing protein [Nannizzia gypsea CBS 118893]